MNEKEKQEMQRLKDLELKQKARNKANNEIIKNNYDRISATLPKGTKERIAAAGETANGLINKLVLNWLEMQDQKTK